MGETYIFGTNKKITGDYDNAEGIMKAQLVATIVDGQEVYKA